MFLNRQRETVRRGALWVWLLRGSMGVWKVVWGSVLRDQSLARVVFSQEAREPVPSWLP